MQILSSKNYLNNKARESLVSFNRLMAFFLQFKENNIEQDVINRAIIIRQDIKSLSDYTNFISTKVTFLLDATLGLINIEQNNIIKIFSVAAVIFLPPTLIASIYGMNFRFMPVLNYKWGYWVALISMLLSAWLPYKFFKFKRWL